MSGLDDVKTRIRELSSRGLDPYLAAYRYPVTATAEEVKARYSSLPPGSETSDRVSVAGRVWHIRRHGGISFIDLYDHTGRIQLVVRRDVLADNEKLRIIFENLGKGDLIGVKGRVVKTKMGE
ncbi:MAG: OB-fold nucleic acid binding domain-containing protein, partial [Acidilobaceae archaeon]